MSTIHVCGLLPIEKELLKNKGECKACLYNDSHMERNEFIRFCSKTSKRLQEEKTDCKDWLLDTR